MLYNGRLYYNSLTVNDFTELMASHCLSPTIILIQTESHVTVHASLIIRMLKNKAQISEHLKSKVSIKGF